MRYVSTRGASPDVSFQEAVLNGLAPDGGLYLPTADGRRLTEGEAGWEAWLRQYSGFDAEDAFAFPLEAIRLDERTWVLELFHGPTAAFKDFGARFMARVLPHCHRGNAPLTLLTATSGDTGAAVAQGFHGVPGVRVFVLYPKGRVSAMQEAQFATLGGNITALEVDGSFDDCQRLVKAAFADADLTGRLTLTSANSINIARLLPQATYYFRALELTGMRGAETAFVVPSGNFGNLTAGVLAARDAFPEAAFLAATNANDVVPAYLAGAGYEPRASVATLSNAMDVGAPSNFERLHRLFDGDDARLRAFLGGAGIDDADTRAEIRLTYDRFGYAADPHTATGLAAWRRLRDTPRYAGRTGIVLATAHPAKFMDVMESVLPGVVRLPDRLAERMRHPIRSIRIPAAFEALSGVVVSGSGS